MFGDAGCSEPIRRPRPKRLSSANRPGTDRQIHAAITTHDSDEAGPSNPRKEQTKGLQARSPSSAGRRDQTTSVAISLLASPSFESDLGIDLPVDLSHALRRRSSARPPRRSSTATDENTPQSSQEKSPTGRPKRRVLSEMQSPLESRTDGLLPHNLEKSSSNEVSISAQASYDSVDDFESVGVGELTRSQLEGRLARATEIIKERERDLGIAAAVGQALLGKNLSLRQHHSDVTSQPLPALDSLERIVEGQVPLTTPLPLYSPPRSDLAPDTSSRSLEDDDETPRIEQVGFFPSPSASPVYEVVNTHCVRAASFSSTGSTSQVQDEEEPSATLASIPRSGTRRQLDRICAQNDHLLQQLAQLQSENEQAKRQDGRRLKKLKREIDGLHCELEAAETRNSQLEEEALAKAGRLAGVAPVGGDDSPDEDATELPVGHPDRYMDHDEPLTSATGALSRSSSTRSRRTVTENERVLVEQLIRKVHELEEMNAALTQEAGERDERIGRFLVDSERLCDMYDAVESEAASELGSVDIERSSPSWWSPGPSTTQSSPFQARRGRGAGNRHFIEGRRTLRSVMRSPAAAPAPQHPRLASPFSQPRPRIFVTPSIEDLREKMKQQRDGVEGTPSGDSCDPHVDGPEAGWEHRPDSYNGSDDGYNQSPAVAIKKQPLGSELALCEAELVQTRHRLEGSDSCQLDLSRSHRRSGSSFSLQSAAESDIADAYAAEQASVRNIGDLAPQRRLALEDAAQNYARNRLPQLSFDEDFFIDSEDSVIMPGSLCDGQQTSYDDYNRIERMTAQTALAWADDDDFGKPITERHARRIGLLDAPRKLQRKVSTKFLAWARPAHRNAKGKAKEEVPIESYKQIESSEDVELRHERQALLRKQRQNALRWRMANGQLSTEEATRRGAFQRLAIEATPLRMSVEAAFEAELTRRTFASRRTNRTSLSGRFGSPELRHTRRSHDGKPDNAKQSKSRALTLVERYHPDALRRRVNAVSAEAAMWVASWAAFSVVMVLAFIATFARGPRRVLNERRI